LQKSDVDDADVVQGSATDMKCFLASL